jgi:RNA polymerase sigma factor (sigma-70 family)
MEDERASGLTDAASDKLLRDVETRFDTAQVIEKLRGLKDEYREVVIMKYLDEMTSGEIADALGKSATNVRVLLHRATKALTEAIQHDQQGTRKTSLAVKE